MWGLTKLIADSLLLSKSYSIFVIRLISIAPDVLPDVLLLRENIYLDLTDVYKMCPYLPPRMLEHSR